MPGHLNIKRQKWTKQKKGIRWYKNEITSKCLCHRKFTCKLFTSPFRFFYSLYCLLFPSSPQAATTVLSTYSKVSFRKSVLITICIYYTCVYTRHIIHLHHTSTAEAACVCHCLLLRPGPGIEAEKIRTRTDWITMPFAGLQHYVKALLAWFGVTSKQIPA